MISTPTLLDVLFLVGCFTTRKYSTTTNCFWRVKYQPICFWSHLELSVTKHSPHHRHCQPVCCENLGSMAEAKRCSKSIRWQCESPRPPAISFPKASTNWSDYWVQDSGSWLLPSLLSQNAGFPFTFLIAGRWAPGTIRKALSEISDRFLQVCF